METYPTKVTGSNFPSPSGDILHDVQVAYFAGDSTMENYPSGRILEFGGAFKDGAGGPEIFPIWYCYGSGVIPQNGGGVPVEDPTQRTFAQFSCLSFDGELYGYWVLEDGTEVKDLNGERTFLENLVPYGDNVSSTFQSHFLLAYRGLSVSNNRWDDGGGKIDPATALNGYTGTITIGTQTLTVVGGLIINVT